MTVYVIVQLKLTDRVANDRYQARSEANVLLAQGFTP